MQRLRFWFESSESHLYPTKTLPHSPHYDLLPAATDESLPIRADGDAINLVWMTCKGSYQFPGVQIPDFDGFVVTPTHNDVPIRADSYGFNSV
jgi:hypothetical protein